MPALSFYSNNWPTFHQHRHNTTLPPPPPPELSSPFHDNFNNHFSSFNNGFTATNNDYLPFHNSIKYPTLSSSYNPLITHQCYSNSPFIPNYEYDHEGFFQGQIQDNFRIGPEAEVFPLSPMEKMQPEYYSYPTYPIVPDVCSMEHTQPELPPLPEIYQCGASSSEIYPTYIGGHESNIKQGDERSGERRLSAQSMAARVRRRKISEKTLELGKLVPGGHRMTTAEMFQAAYKYIKFLQAQVGVLQLMSSSKELGSELQDLVTSPSVQEKLYTAGKCIVSHTLAKTLADDHQGI